ncbi:hypothetical protein AB0E83_08165 [Streptomyces sp. NPDC035033]|uniref:hypothetical protein n=1 Tax=Streptomyces sp. NPDC035033 TaxID=3155368 RepID=UPI0033FA3309
MSTTTVSTPARPTRCAGTRPTGPVRPIRTGAVLGLLASDEAPALAAARGRELAGPERTA